MTDEEDPFGGGIELEFDAMEARRQAAEVKPTEPAFADLGAPPDGAPPLKGPAEDGFPEFVDYPAAPPPTPAAPVSTSDLTGGALPERMGPKKYTQEDLKGYTRPPPPLWRSIAIVLGFIIVGGGILAFWYRHDLFPPDPVAIVGQISEGPEQELVFDGTTYQATFKLDQEVEGASHQLKPVHYPHAPFITHQLVLLTGDFTDPSKVEMGELEGERVFFTLKVDKPKGAASIISIIPADAKALSEVNRITKGQYVVLIGDVLEGPLTDPAGEVTVTVTGTGELVRVREVLFDQEPTPDDSDDLQ